MAQIRSANGKVILLPQNITTMPITPKQQPPYYKPEPMPTPTTSGDYTRLNVQYTDLTTSGTSETDLYLYTIPANTLSQNGDTLQIKFGVIKSGINNPAVVRYYFDGTNQLGAFTELQYQAWTIQIIRTSSTTARIIFELTPETGQDTTIFQTVNSLDFTATIATKFTGEAQTGDALQTYSMTIDKITN